MLSADSGERRSCTRNWMSWSLSRWSTRSCSFRARVSPSICSMVCRACSTSWKRRASSAALHLRAGQGQHELPQALEPVLAHEGHHHQHHGRQGDGTVAHVRLAHEHGLGHGRQQRCRIGDTPHQREAAQHHHEREEPEAEAGDARREAGQGQRRVLHPEDEPHVHQGLGHIQPRDEGLAMQGQQRRGHSQVERERQRIGGPVRPARQPQRPRDGQEDERPATRTAAPTRSTRRRCSSTASSKRESKVVVVLRGHVRGSQTLAP